MEGARARRERLLPVPMAAPAAAAAAVAARSVPQPRETLLAAPAAEPQQPATQQPGPQAAVITANSQTPSHTGSSTNTTLQAFYTLLQHVLLSHSSPSISSIGWWDFHL